MAKILVLDDDTSFREMLHETLVRIGHEVISDSDGINVSKIIADHPIDLVITDIIMPEAEGLEVIIELRKKAPRIRIIAISGGGRINAHDYLKFAQAFGAACTLAKPFSEQELISAIETALAV